MKRLIPVIILLFTFCSCEEEQILEGENNSLSTFKTVTYLNEEARQIYKDNPDKALDMALQALSLAEKEGYLEGQKQSHNTLSFIYSNEFKDQKQANYHSGAFIRLNEEVEANKDLALFNYQTGYTLFKQNKLADAMPYLFEARDLYLSQGDFEKEAYSLYALSRVFEKVGQYDKGIEYLNKVDIEGLHKSFSWSVYHHRGKLYLELKNYSEARKDFSHAYAIVAELQKPKKEAMILNGLALVLIEMNELEQADHFIDEGLQIAKASRDIEAEALFYLKEGYKHEKALNHRDAIVSYQRAFELASHNELEKILLDASLDLSNCYNKLGNYAKALYYAKLGIRKASEKYSDKAYYLYRNISVIGGITGDSLTFYKYQSKAEQLKSLQFENSEYADVHKQDLAYRDKVDERRHEDYVRDVQEEIAEHERYTYFYMMFCFLLAFATVFVLTMRGPIHYLSKKAERYNYLMEELMAAFKKRLRGKGPIFPAPEPLKPPVLPDERDLHNLWSKKRHGRKGDKDKGKDDPAPGLDDDE
ncbi:MAG: tetratricopeptide repeat protein [Cyclobacteriaceae bacterium]